MTNAPRPQVPAKRGFSAVPFFGDLLALLRLLRDRDASGWMKLVAVAALVYVASPVDALPEGLAPAIGWLDDVGLVLALRGLLSSRLEPYRYPLFGRRPAVGEGSSPAARVAGSRPGPGRCEIVDAEFEEIAPRADRTPA